MMAMVCLWPNKCPGLFQPKKPAMIVEHVVAAILELRVHTKLGAPGLVWRVARHANHSYQHYASLHAKLGLAPDATLSQP